AALSDGPDSAHRAWCSGRNPWNSLDLQPVHPCSRAGHRSTVRRGGAPHGGQMATPSSMIARLRARRGDWRTLIQPRSVAVVIALGGIVVLTFGLNFIGPAREGLPVLSRQPVRLFAGTVAAAREVFSGAGDD